MKTTFKTNCCEINTNEICRLITLYQAKTGEQPNYIIMSRGTCELLKSQIERLIMKCQFNSTVVQFCGIDIAECDKLKFGEVEVV